MKTFRQFFRPSVVTDNGDPIPFIWIGDRHRAVCMNPDSTRVYASVWHDGCGKFYPTIYVPFPSAIRILSQGAAFGLRLNSFPRCALDLFRLKCRSMADARKNLEELLFDLHVI
jgi:hypothetical protein